MVWIELSIRGDDEISRRNIYHVSLWTTSVTFLLSLFIWQNFDTADAGFQMVETAETGRDCL